MHAPIRSFAVHVFAILLSCATAPCSADPALARFAAAVESAYPGTPTLDTAAFLARDDRERFVLVDARSPAEIAVSRIPDAIGPDELPALRAGRPVLVYCTVGMRSAKVTQQLRAAGIEAWNLTGGILGWAAAGGALVDPRGEPTRKVHTYGARWNHLPPGYEAVW
jgi:rhodanese-related sulfurtransferase